jgi:hypothetical protein
MKVALVFKLIILGSAILGLGSCRSARPSSGSLESAESAEIAPFVVLQSMPNACKVRGRFVMIGQSVTSLDGCSECTCSRDMNPPSLSCTEGNCFLPNPLNFSKAREVICQKHDTDRDIHWEIKLRDGDGDGEFLVFAYRNGEIAYDPDEDGSLGLRNSRRLILKRELNGGKVQYVSQGRSAFLTIDANGTGYFQTARLGRAVQDLNCVNNDR